MKAIVAVAGSLVLASCSQLAAEQPAPKIEQLTWLAGTWTSEQDNNWSEEHWSTPRAGMMIGVGRSGDGKALGSFEYLRVEAREEDSLVYVAAPGGSDATEFVLDELSSSSATFVNPAHDFPQRIRYARDGDTLAVEISLADGSEAIGWALTLTD